MKISDLVKSLEKIKAKHGDLPIAFEAAMKTKVVEFFFMKMNGEVRQAFGTLLQSHIDYTPNGTGHAASRDCIRYWDEEKGAWRQFKAYNFLRVA